MSPFAWLRSLFASETPPEDPNVIPDLEDNEPFVFSQHLRIIAAIIFCILSAGILWWIMA